MILIEEYFKQKFEEEDLFEELQAELSSVIPEMENLLIHSHPTLWF